MYRAVDKFAERSERTPILRLKNKTRGSCESCCPDINDCVKNFYEVIPTRYVFALISSLGIFNVYAMRINLSVALVAMVRSPSESELHADDNTACKELLRSISNNITLYSNMTTPSHGEFDWDASTQANILAAFFYGYVITQIPGGIIAEKYGAKWLYGLGILITAIFTLFTPLAARWGPGWLMAVRAIEGLGEGVTYPAMNALIGRWVPKNERSRIATVIFSGSPIGTVVSLAGSGYLSASDKYGGWPMVFYLFGTLGCIWFVFWMFLMSESPEEHPTISKSELRYILGGQDRLSPGSSSRIPWRSILTSTPVWTLVITHWGFNWGHYTLITELPTYLDNILHFDLKHNGLLSALPYLFHALFAFLASAIADRMRSSGRYKITTIRKLMNSIAFFIPCVVLGCVSYVGCDTTVIITLFMLSLAFSGFMYSGFNVTHVDMSPQYAGTLMGITNCVANTAGFLAPLYAGAAIHRGQTIENWRTVFLTTSAVYLVSGLIYLFFASAELQSWGLSPTPTDEEASTGKKELPK